MVLGPTEHAIKLLSVLIMHMLNRISKYDFDEYNGISSKLWLPQTKEKHQRGLASLMDHLKLLNMTGLRVRKTIKNEILQH